MSKPILAVVKSECNKEDKKICLNYLRNNVCDMSRGCKKALMLNPLCFSEENSCKNISIQKIKDKEYILYYCNNSCPFFVHKHADKLLEGIERDDIIYGDKLDKLLKSANVESPSTKTNDNDLGCIRFIINSLRM
jgi:hypothetical protein